jgi:hypothetical protein
MALISLNIQVEQLTEVLASFDRIKVYRSTTGSGGPFVEITTPTTRLVLEAGKSSYQFDDLSGEPDYFYCVSYFNASTSLESSKSEPTPGERDPALDLVSAADIRERYLFGLDLTDDSGTPLPDSLYEHYIKSAVSWLEARLDIKIATTVVTNEEHDFFKNDYHTYILLQTDHVPVLSIERIELVLPTAQKVIQYRPEWVNSLLEAGQINVIPGNGELSVVTLGLSGAWLPFVYGRTKHLPNVFQMDYTAGFAKGKVPPVLIDAIGMYASFGPLNILGDLIAGAGIASQSISLDGLSQSVNTTSSATNSGYGARILQYTKQLKDMLPQLRRAYHPIGLAVV